MTLRNRKVVGIVSRRTLHDGRTEIHIDIVIADDRKLLAVGRIDAVLADQMLALLIVGVDDDAHIAEHRLRTGCCDDEMFMIFNRLIVHVVHLARIFLVDDFNVAEGGTRFRIPVDDPPSTVDQPLVVQRHKDMADRLVEAFIHGEALSGIIKTVAELCPLLPDRSGVLFLPLPGAVEELFTADVIARNAFRLQAGINLCLRRNAGMIHARQIQNIIALHPLIAADDILQRIVPGMTKVQNPGHIGRRNDNCKRVFGFVPGREIAGPDPLVITAVFHSLMIVLCGEFFLHLHSPVKSSK